MRRRPLSHFLTLLAAVALFAAAGAGDAMAMASHAGWPSITGVRLMNKLDQSRPLDGRPGHDPFDGTDTSYSCGGLDNGGTGCFHNDWWTCTGATSSSANGTPGAPSGPTALKPVIPDLPGGYNIPHVAPDACAAGRLAVVIPPDIGHNELLGGHGNNTIYAGPAGDVIWGDYKPSGDPTTQVNHLYGGAGNDYIYAAHGLNYIWTGGGRDVVHAHFGGGEIHCQSSTVSVYISRPSQRRYKLFGCRHVSF